MIQKHPEALAEMDDVMTKIGHKWEQYDVQTTDLPHDHHILSDSSFSEPIYSSYPRPAPHPDPVSHPPHHYHHHHRRHHPRPGPSMRHMHMQR